MSEQFPRSIYDTQRNAGDPYAMNAIRMKKQHGPETFKTTYGDSYKNLPTQKVSPLIAEYYDFFGNAVDPSQDQSPYPLARDCEEPINRKPYQILDNPPTDRPEVLMDQDSTRFEQWTLKRDNYSNPLPHRDYIAREQDQPKQDPRDEYKKYHKGPSPRDMHHYQHRNYEHHEELKKPFCNKCFKSDTCMNRLCCIHQYCDECMANIPVMDRQFRDSIRWHYCCDVCNKLTSDPKLVRVDPSGRRLLRYQDVNTFTHANQQQ